MQRRINVRGIIINETGQLFCQRLLVRASDGRDFWCTPGGGLESGESLHDGLRREMIEETGVAPVIGQLLFIQQFRESGENSAHGPSEQLEFFFHISNWQDYQQIDLATTTHGQSEVAECGFVDSRTETVLPRFLAEVDLIAATAQSQPVQCISYLPPVLAH